MQDKPPANAKKIARRRDIAAMTGISALLLIMLAVSGALGLANALAAITALSALAVIYYLLVKTAPEPAEPPVKDPLMAPGPGEHEVVAAAMIESLPDPILLLGPGGRIDQANQQARDFLGLSRDGGNIASLIRQPKVLEAITAALDGRRPASVEYSTRAPYESYVRAFVSPLPAKPGEPRQAMMLLHDETAARRAERMRADFLANASHELRTPLASLSGFIETLRGHAKEDPEARDRFLDIMGAQVERMRRLINDLLSLSRIEMDEHLPPSGTVDLVKIAHDVVETLKPIAAAKHVRIVFEKPDSLPVTGDRDQLMAVIQNLTDNAIKYADTGGEVTLTLARAGSSFESIRPPERIIPNSGRMTIVSPADDGAVGLIRVRDHGPGIERAHLPRLAQRFYRVEGGKSEARKGTGLGLAIVKHVAARHRGGFAVESAQGAGTLFAVCVPANGEPSSDGGEAQRAEPVHS